MAPTFSSIPEKLRNRIRPNSVGCWVWTGAEYAGGYGGAWWKGKKWRVHRLIYTLLAGPITDDTLDHLCRNTRCVNPKHLEPASHRVNTLRGTNHAALNALKTHCKRGHLLVGDNLMPTDRPGRERRCRPCKQLTEAARSLRRKAQGEGRHGR